MAYIGERLLANSGRSQHIRTLGRGERNIDRAVLILRFQGPVSYSLCGEAYNAGAGLFQSSILFDVIVSWRIQVDCEIHR